MLAGSPSINNESIAENTAVFNAADIFEPGEYVRGRDASSRRGLVTVALYGRSELRTYRLFIAIKMLSPNFRSGCIEPDVV